MYGPLRTVPPETRPAAAVQRRLPELGEPPGLQRGRVAREGAQGSQQAQQPAAGRERGGEKVQRAGQGGDDELESGVRVEGAAEDEGQDAGGEVET